MAKPDFIFFHQKMHIWYLGNFLQKEGQKFYSF